MGQAKTTIVIIQPRVSNTVRDLQAWILPPSNPDKRLWWGRWGNGLKKFTRESFRSSSNKWTKSLHWDLLRRTANFSATVWIIFSNEVIFDNTKRQSKFWSSYETLESIGALGQVKKNVFRPDFYKKESGGRFFSLFIISYCMLSLHIITFSQEFLGQILVKRNIRYWLNTSFLNFHTHKGLTVK